MTGATASSARLRRRSRRAAAAWTVGVVAASLVDPALVLGQAGAAGGGPLGIDAFVIAHLLAYGVLTWLLVGTVDPGTKTGPILAVAAAAAVGAGVELLQAPVAYRTASVADALVNAGGAVAGAGVRAAARRRWRRP